LIYVSKETAGRIRGRAARNIQAALAPLVDRKHLVFAGWVRVAGVRVKSYKMNLWDHRVQKRFDQEALGIATTGRDHHVRDEANTMKSSSSDEVNMMKSSSSENGEQDDFCGEQDDIVQTNTMKSSPNTSDSIRPTQPSTTRASLTDDAEERDSKEEQNRVKRLADLLGVRLTARRRARWSADMEELEREGLAFNHVILAIQQQLIRSLESAGPLPSITSLRYFRAAAEKVKTSSAYWPPSETKKFIDGADRHIAELRGQAAAPSDPAPGGNGDRRDEMLMASQVFAELGIEGPTQRQLHSVAQGLRQLRGHGMDFDRHIVVAIRRIAAEGRAPKKPNWTWMHNEVAEVGWLIMDEMEIGAAR
jgi:hypothetical protein